MTRVFLCWNQKSMKLREMKPNRLDAQGFLSFTWTMPRTQLGSVSLLAVLLAIACSAASSTSTGKSQYGVGGSGNTNGGTGSTSNGGDGQFVYSTGGSPPLDPDSGMVCDSTGKCTCINIAEFGLTGTFGAQQGGKDGSTAFQQWLNSKSTAQVDVYATRTTITPDLLAKYQVIILQDLTNVVAYGQQSDFWTYSADEVAAVSDWVNNGGSIISLTGYFSDNGYETIPTNQLLSFSGISYNSDDIITAADCPIDATKNQQICWCWGGAVPITQWNTAEPMTTGISAVGGFRGRSIKAPADATIFATFGGKNVAVGVKVGKGRVFAFADEWITYNSQWNDTSLTQGANFTDPNNPCYNKLPSQEFQIPQFWFNSISWCQPVVSQCFKINEPNIVPVQIN